MHTDPIADLLTRIRNASRNGVPSVDCPMSRVKLEVVKILQEEGYIKGYEVVKDTKFPQVRVLLKYEGVRNQRAAFTHIQRVSKPGLRIYKKAEELRPVLRGLGTAVVSTSHGIMTDAQARQRRIGGEVMCVVW
jgi:small subunit ribosomal protein S8